MGIMNNYGALGKTMGPWHQLWGLEKNTEAFDQLHGLWTYYPAFGPTMGTLDQLWGLGTNNETLGTTIGP